MKLVQQIRNKLDAKKAMVMKADKSSALVIAFQQDCDRKAEHFINSDNFPTLNRDPNITLQEEFSKSITCCTALIPRSNKWKLTDLN
jgi:hypothetical protein